VVRGGTFGSGTSQKFVDSVLVLRLLNHTGRSMALGSTRPLTETSTTGISWG